MTEDIFSEVDVVQESYRRELVMKIFKVINLFIRTEHRDREVTENVIKSSSLYTQIFADDPSVSTKELFTTIKTGIVKWLNFELEPQISSEIFDTMLAIDSFTEDSYSEDSPGKKSLEEIPNSKTDEEILDLCLKALPFFTHLNNKDNAEVNSLLSKVLKLQSLLEKDHRGVEIEELYLENVYTIYNLVVLLIKINGLVNIQNDSDKNAIQTAYRFISSVYECITAACSYSLFAMAIMTFSSGFVQLGWKNKYCNELHFVFLMKMMSKSKSRKLNLDSALGARDIVAKLGHFLPNEELINKTVSGQENPLN